MKRRDFLQSGVMGSAAAIAAHAVPAPANGFHSAEAVPHSLKPFELEEATIQDLQSGMSSGKLTSQSVTKKYLSRIEETNRGGPAVAGSRATDAEELR